MFTSAVIFLLCMAGSNIDAKPLTSLDVPHEIPTTELYLTDDDFSRAKELTDEELNSNDHRVKPWIQSSKPGADYAGQAADAKRGVGFRNGVKAEQEKWPNGVIFYQISSRYGPTERAVIARAMQAFHDKTCIRFQARHSERDYIWIDKIDGCYSDVGRARNRQNVSLDDGCVTYDTAIHELMHAVGFWHEHERYDRDSYINVLWQNVERDQFDQFGKENLYISDYYGESYDYLSIMHYDSKSFSKNGQDTMQATENPAMTDIIGRVKDFSAVDLRKINKMYRCPNH